MTTVSLCGVVLTKREVFPDSASGQEKYSPVPKARVWADRQEIRTARSRCYAAEGVLPYARRALRLRTRQAPRGGLLAAELYPPLVDPWPDRGRSEGKRVPSCALAVAERSSVPPMPAAPNIVTLLRIMAAFPDTRDCPVGAEAGHATG
jgi:hypothetical protein